MEWDQITEKWTQMALRLRSDSLHGTTMLGAGRVNDPLARTAETSASSDGLSPMTSTERTGNDRGLTPDR